MDATEILTSNSYLVLGTADAGGRPWATPVWFAWSGSQFVWVSKPGARHSQNLAVQGAASVVLFDSTVTPGAGEALYADVTAAEVDPADADEALAAYSARSIARGLPAWTLAQVTGEARHRMYAASVTAAWLLDDHDERVTVSMPSGAAS